MEVFFDSNTSIYTYQFWMDSYIDDILNIISPLNLEGLNNVAGWSFSDAEAAGAPVGDTAWEIYLEPGNKRLTWQNPALEGGTRFFDATDGLIRFFYQSTYGPGSGPASVYYTMGNGSTSGIGWAYSPKDPPPQIPEPGTFGLLALGAIALFRFSRSRKRRKRRKRR
jgi:hypothetical protein